MPLRVDFARISKGRFHKEFQDRLLIDADEEEGVKDRLLTNADEGE